VLAVSLAACTSEKVDLPEDPARRQVDLGERLLAWASLVKAGSPEELRRDAGLAVAEVVLLDHAGRLRLLAAGGPALVSNGAARAIARIRAAREKNVETAAVDCARHETLTVVQLACLDELRDTVRAAWVKELVAAVQEPARLALVSRHLSATLPPGGWRNELLSALENLPEQDRASPDVVAIRDALTRPAVDASKPGADKIVELLRGEAAETRRSGLRALLEVAGTLRADSRVNGELSRLLHDPDLQARHLAEAVFLRRSLHDRPSSLAPVDVPAEAGE